VTKDTDPSDRGAILVVEDHELVCEGIRGMLEAAGFAALTALSGHTGIALFHRRASEIRAVLLDLRLPGESTAEVFDAMRRLRPDLPVILISGTPEAIARQELTRPGLTAFLQKPLDRSALVRIIREALKGSPSRDEEESPAG
jgi:DNA-binding NtrC family response regulator